MFLFSKPDEYQYLDARLMVTIFGPQVSAYPVFWFGVFLR